jgi:site-specific recombinase XerD
MGGGAARLKELTAADVRSALAQIATSRSTRAVQMTRNSLVRVIRYAEANDLVNRNGAALITPPKGPEGCPSHVRRAFPKVWMAAGIGENWSPRELRHTFVSIMSEQSVPVEEIARLVGHCTTSADERIGTSLQNELHSPPSQGEVHAPQTAANRTLAQRARLEKSLSDASKGITACSQLVHQFLARPKTSAGEARA